MLAWVSSGSGRRPHATSRRAPGHVHSAAKQCIVNTIIKLGDEVFSAPRAQVMPCETQPLGRDSRTRCRGDVDRLVQEFGAGIGVSEAQAREGQVCTDDAELHRVLGCLQRSNRSAQAVVRLVRVAGMECAQPVETVEAIRVEPSVWIIDRQLFDSLPCAVEGSVGITGLTCPSAYFRVDGVGTGSDGVTVAVVGVEGGRAGDLAGRFEVIGRVQGHHCVARRDGRSVASVRQLLGDAGGLPVQRKRCLVVAGFERQARSEGVGVGGERDQLSSRICEVELQQPTAGLHDRCELELEADERGCADLAVDCGDRVVELVEDAVVEHPWIAPDGGDVRLEFRGKGREQIAVATGRALDDQADEFLHFGLWRLEIAEGVQVGVEVRSGAECERAGRCPGVEVGQEESVASLRAGGVGGVFPPRDGTLNGGQRLGQDRCDGQPPGGVAYRLCEVVPGPASVLAQLTQLASAGLPICGGHDVQYTIRRASDGHDQSWFSLVGGIVDGVPRATGASLSLGEAGHDVAAVDHPSVAGVISSGAELVSAQLDDVGEPARCAPTANRGCRGCRLISHGAGHDDGQQRLSVFGQPVEGHRVDADSAADVDMRGGLGERSEVCLKQVFKRRFGSADAASPGDRQGASHGCSILYECHQMSSTEIVPTHDLMNAPAAARTPPARVAAGCPYPSTCRAGSRESARAGWPSFVTRGSRDMWGALTVTSLGESTIPRRLPTWRLPARAIVAHTVGRNEVI